ncbi:MAG: tRNA (guanosine(46)-N7)-methyltransferase TrmB [Alistipes sp.]|jgi:tRNA (guanine-N7-)-methyltransferase|nr:tRNA (guanosine(46)-N7)-methyltransferase TrmB [Alistipes sp.]
MGKDKLRKFAENLTFDNLVQPEFDDIFRRDHPLKGHWGVNFFGRPGNANGPHVATANASIATAPITLELGCGKGEYTVGLGAANPGRNFLGVDIKGARMWRGAKTAVEMGLANVGFLRTRIEFIDSFFGPGEISEVWITFPDPQLKKGREKKRLTSPVFLDYYRRFLAPGGVIHLKTDSRELHDYTLEVIAAQGLPLHAASADIYGTELPEGGTLADRGTFAEKEPTLKIKTTYERRFLEEGKPITYIRFGLSQK